MAAVQLFICMLAVYVTLTTAEERKAVATLTTTNGAVSGSVTFTQTDDGPVHIVGEITGLSQGNHGFHIHEKGDLSGGCGSTGGHYNPEHKHHGGPQDNERHVGDLGQILADENKVARIDTTDSKISLTGTHSIIGRAVVVHALPDDMGKGGTDESKKTGSAGARLGCGVIGIH